MRPRARPCLGHRMKRKLKVGIAGCGVIGSQIAKIAVSDLKNKINLVSIFDIDKKKEKTLERGIKKKIGARSLGQLIKKSELIIEAVKKGLRVKEVPISIMKRKFGKSKKGRDLNYGFHFAKTIIKTWWR